MGGGRPRGAFNVEKSRHLLYVSKVNNFYIAFEQEMKYKATAKHSGTEYAVTISLKHRTPMSQCIQLYNVLFNSIMKRLNYVLIQRNYFSADNVINVEKHR